MDNRWRLQRAVDTVSELRRLLHSYGYSFDLTSALAPEDLAQAYLGCQIIPFDGLTDRRALEYLAREWEVDISDEEPKDEPLSGGLYIAEGGTHRWIFLEPAEHPRRRKFTVGHEMGHLIREALPHLEQEACSLGTLLPEEAPSRLLKYGRCTLTRRERLTPADKLELDANDFAAELLMPREGVLGLLRQHFPNGFQSRQQIDDFARLVASTYEVSIPAAERHISNFSFQVTGEGPNHDLFAV